MARLIRANGACSLHRSRPRPFNILGWSIVNQQLSSRAAHTIAARILRLCGDRELTPGGLMSVSREALRATGLSWRKVDYLRSLASATLSGQLNFRRLAQLDDGAVSRQLTALPGIGPWTAQMYLMFALRRGDVFSPGDVGLQRAAHDLYGLEARPQGEDFERFAERWRPWRTIAAWHLWRHVD